MSPPCPTPHDIQLWLTPPAHFSFRPDIFSIGFQEIVPLTAQQIAQADPQKLRLWEKTILQTFATRPNKKSDYILLRSEQLVGTALLILVRADLAQAIRKVEGANKKVSPRTCRPLPTSADCSLFLYQTGLRGMAGNKGGVAIRMEFYDTSICFVTAHLAAGHSNVAERNADYRTIAEGLRFQKGKTIASHDFIFWAGDFNYRVELAYEDAVQLAEGDSLAPLLQADQVSGR